MEKQECLIRDSNSPRKLLLGMRLYPFFENDQSREVGQLVENGMYVNGIVDEGL